MRKFLPVYYLNIFLVIENLLLENDISHTRNRKIYDESGKVLGEIDIETDSHIIETTVSKNGEHKQIRKYKTDVFNPENKDVILYIKTYWLKKVSRMKVLQL